jgi:hypothetical protein
MTGTFPLTSLIISQLEAGKPKPSKPLRHLFPYSDSPALTREEADRELDEMFHMPDRT